MDVRLGYVANCLSLGIGTSHTCRVANATARRLNELIAVNLEELERILRFNEARGIGVFRIGSSLVPLASHPVNRVRWWRTFARDFARLGAIAARSGQRLSFHPSPAGASLSSQHARVRAATVAELLYSTRVLDLLGQGPEARVIVHVGGAAPDRATALDAAHRFLDAMPDDARRRLAIENDDRVWAAREAWGLARDHGLAFIADFFHHRVLPSKPGWTPRQLARRSAQTWRELGLRPKYHLASQREGAKPGAHADLVRPEDALAALAALEGPADVMLEAKEKDRALFALREALGPRLGAGLLETGAGVEGAGP